jgi:tRNA wybutosine-synthesizing protein 1
MDEPETIINESIEAQKSLVTGLGGVEHGEKELREANLPNQAAISLAGEPTIYPKLSELIQGYKERNFSTFLVTNGTLPEKLELLKTLPTNLYISLSAFDENLHKKLENPILNDSWKRINQSLKWLSSVDTTTVIRLTLVKDWNMTNPEKYAELISKAGPKFIEVKAFMPVGWSQKRLPFESMPSHEEVKDFSEKIAQALNYKIKDEQKESRVVLLSK